MTRTLLDARLHKIRTKITQLGRLVETALEQALKAVKEGDQALCTQLIADDQTIDDLCGEVEQLALQLLVLQQPLGGRDLRFLSSVSSLTRTLERMGDNVSGIAKLLLRLMPLQATGTKKVEAKPAQISHQKSKKHSSEPALTEDLIVSELLDLGQEALRVLHGTMQAFEQNDPHSSRTIWQEDDVVDVRYHMIRHDLMTMFTGMQAIAALQQDTCIMQRMTYWFWIAHNLERVGDHCTNMCERIVFYLEGDGTIQPEEPI